TWDAASFGATFEDGPIPHSLLDDASHAREQMIESIAEHDDELMAAWVSGRELSPDQIRKSLRRVTLANKGVPTLMGAAFKNQAIHNLLAAVPESLRPPADIGDIRGRNGELLETRKVGDNEPLAALAFKVQTDDAGGQLTFVRVYTGILRVGQAVLN